MERRTHHTHAQQLIASSGTATAAIWDKSHDCLSVLQFRASADAGLCLEVAVSLRSSLPEPPAQVGKSRQLRRAGEGLLGAAPRAQVGPAQNPPWGSGGSFHSPLCTWQRLGFHRSHGAKLGFDQSSRPGQLAFKTSLGQLPAPPSLPPQEILGENSSPLTSRSCHSPQ